MLDNKDYQALEKKRFSGVGVKVPIEVFKELRIPTAGVPENLIGLAP